MITETARQHQRTPTGYVELGTSDDPIGYGIEFEGRPGHVTVISITETNQPWTVDQWEATAAAWRVDDLEAIIVELQGRGLVFEEYDYADLKTTDGIAVAADGTKVAWFKDSEGNILGLDQLPT